MSILEADARQVPGRQYCAESQQGKRFFILVLALIAGTGLAISGTVMQAVLRNPLASSYTLGVSSGTGFGAALAIGLGMGIWGGKYIVVANAFVFVMASMFLVYGIARIRGAGPGMLITTSGLFTVSRLLHVTMAAAFTLSHKERCENRLEIKQ